MLTTRRDAKYGRITQENVVVMGVTENATRIGTMREITTGRSLIDDDVDRGSAVAVIGSDVADAFFPNMEPLGKEFEIDGHAVRVIGVVEKKGTVFGNSQDNFMWVPISYFQKMYGNRRSVDIMVQARSMDTFETAQDQARVVMRNRRHLGFNKPDDFSVETGESVLELWQNATRGIYVVTVVVTGISLIVGGVVVMNIMLVSVTERIREIGVRKALGARRRDILRQFLVESVILSLFGGLLGLVGAAVFSWGLATVLGNIMSTTFTAPVRLWAVMLALFVSTVVGLVAGIYPAGRAAALDPVVALRNE
jgi:putative ABC transport system permease protein